MKKSVLITGVAGFLGYHTAKFLLAKGYQVVGVDNLSGSQDAQLKLQRLSELGVFLTPESYHRIHPVEAGDFSFFKADILDDQLWSILKLHAEADYAIHYANQDFQFRMDYSTKELLISSFRGFLNLLDWGKDAGVKKLVYLSPCQMRNRVEASEGESYFLSQASHSVNEFWLSTSKGYYGFDAYNLDVPLVFGSLISPYHPMALLGNNIPKNGSNWLSELGLERSTLCCPAVGFTSSLRDLLENKTQTHGDSRYLLAEEYWISLDEYQDVFKNFLS